MSALLPAGAVTGVGSLPGEDPRAALELVRRWAPELPFWPQLPALSDMLVEVLGPGPAPADRAGLLRRLEAPAGPDPPGLQGFLAAARGGGFPRARAWKGQIAGPVTVVAALGLKADEVGARAAVTARVGALAASQARALAGLALEGSGGPVTVWLDEPVLGLSPPPDAPELLGAALGAVRAAGARAGIHVCSPPPWALLRRVAPDLVSFDAWRDLEASARDPDCAALLAQGTWLAAGLVPTRASSEERRGLRAAELFRRLWLAWRRLGDPRDLASRTLVTASCGLGLLPAAEVEPSFALARALGTWVAAEAR